MGSTAIPVQPSGTALHMILRTIVPCPAATDRRSAVESCRVISFHLPHPVIAIGHPVAGRLISCRHHHERRMMTIGINDTFRLIQQILVDYLSSPKFYTMIRPRRSLRLKIDAQLIRSDKGCLRRAIGMKTNMIQPILLDLRKNSGPRLLVCRRIARLRETAVLYGSTQEQRPTVDIQLSPLGLDLTHTEGGLIIIVTDAYA